MKNKNFSASFSQVFLGNGKRQRKIVCILLKALNTII